MFWFIGGVDPDTYANAEREGRLSELPTNHNPKFAPVIHPTLGASVCFLMRIAGLRYGPRTPRRGRRRGHRLP